MAARTSGKITQASRDIRDQRHDDAVTWAGVTP
jgi:hypothetical protein